MPLEFACANCGAAIAIPATGPRVETACAWCHAEISADVFPAFSRGIARGKPAENVLIGDESSCFYHPAKKASIVCDTCGRFLCSVCDVELGGAHLCPACVAARASAQRSVELRRDIVRYDHIALLLAIVPLFPAFLLFTLVTAPMAIAVALWFWKKQASILPHYRWRFVVAIVFGAAEIIGWGVAAYFMGVAAFYR